MPPPLWHPHIVIVMCGVSKTLDEKGVTGGWLPLGPFGGERESHSKSPESLNVISDNRRISSKQEK